MMVSLHEAQYVNQANTLQPQESEKAKRYIALLDTARCNGNWDQVPELVRKVTKHAPHRTCTAERST
jgi:hypothetical protein